MIAALTLTQVSVNLGYDTAAESYADAAASANREKTLLRAESADLQSVIDSAGLILPSENEAIVVEAATEVALAGAVTEAEDAVTAAQDLIDADIPVAGEKPTWFWELFGATTRLDEDSDETAVTAYTALQNAADEVVATENAELAEKAGPLLNARLEIEAFARSLAPGVLLEFDWAPIVNSAGNNGSLGGYTTWWWDDPGRSVIELSNSVAEQWPADRSKALVAHEVGHAISVKCEDMYDSSTQDSIEKWATAWAISMGFTDDANGVWAYGYPPQSYIDAATSCR